VDESRARLRTIILCGLQLVIALIVARQLTRTSSAEHLASDIGHYLTIGRSHGTPYRNFSVEYPPLTVLLFKILPSTFDAFAYGMLAINATAQAAIVGMMFVGWGRRAAWSYLVLSAPLLPVFVSRFDLVAVAAAVLGAYLLSRRFPLAAGISWTVGAFVKLWPVVLVPALAARREWRAFFATVALGCAGLLAWVAWGGLGAPGQVTGYRGATGWEFESLPGSLLRLVTRRPLRFETGAWRLGAPAAIVGFTLSLAMIAAVVATWWFVSRRDVRPGTAEVVVTGIVLVTGTLLSPQFIAWVLPFVAIAGAAGARRLEGWAGAVVAFTFVAWALFDVNDAGRLSTEVAVLARNVALGGLLVVAALDLLRSPIRVDSPQLASESIAA
jgi:hypothetical protein